MTTTFESVPYQNYSRGDINNISGVNANGKAVLQAIQGYDRSGDGTMGCFAQVKVIADDAGLTVGQTRNIISRLHQRGFIAFIGMRGRRSVCRRVVIQGGVRLRTTPKQLITAEEILTSGVMPKLPGHVKITKVTRLEVPTVEEIRADRSVFLSESETLVNHSPSEDETQKGLDEKNKDNPPAAGCSSSFSSERSSEVSCPEEAKDIPVKSHKKKDWVAMVEKQPFIDVLKKRFPGYSSIEARLLMNLINHKGVSPARIGHALENLHYVPRDAENNQPARPLNLAGFCKKFLAVQEVVLREVANFGQHDNEAELQNFADDPDEVIRMSVRHMNSFKDGFTLVDWVNDEKYHSYRIWPDVIRLSVEYQAIGKALVWLLSDAEKSTIFRNLGYCAAGAKASCERNGLEFESVFGWSYEEVVDAAEKLKAKWLAERDHYHKPECWTPNPWFRNQQAA